MFYTLQNSQVCSHFSTPLSTTAVQRTNVLLLDYSRTFQKGLLLPFMTFATYPNPEFNALFLNMMPPLNIKPKLVFYSFLIKAKVQNTKNKKFSELSCCSMPFISSLLCLNHIILFPCCHVFVFPHYNLSKHNFTLEHF